MTFRSLLPYLAAGVVALVVALASGMYLVPALRDGRESVATVQRRTQEIEARLPELGGAIYEDSLKTARSRGEAFLNDALGVLSIQRDHLHRWFPRLDLKKPDEKPDKEKFWSVYGFSQDELTRSLVGVVKQRTGREVPTIVQYRPEFVAQNRHPYDLAEMEREQRRFNLQRLLFVAAAGQGASSIQAPEFKDDWATGPGERIFDETRVTLVFEVEDRRAPALVRALLALEGDGPIVRLDGLSTRPRPLPKSLAEAQSLLLEMTVTLGLFELAPASAGAERKG